MLCYQLCDGVPGHAVGEWGFDRRVPSREAISLLKITTESFHRKLWSLVFPDRDVVRTTVEEDNKGSTYTGNHPVTNEQSQQQAKR